LIHAGFFFQKRVGGYGNLLELIRVRTIVSSAEENEEMRYDLSHGKKLSFAFETQTISDSVSPTAEHHPDGIVADERESNYQCA
jgi:hypothetical protein